MLTSAHHIAVTHTREAAMITWNQNFSMVGEKSPEPTFFWRSYIQLIPTEEGSLSKTYEMLLQIKTQSLF